VSHLLESGSTTDKIKIIDEITDDIVELSMHKFGSNVVEKCLIFSPPERKIQLVDSLVSVPTCGTQYPCLVDLMTS
jgi:Pumilio-family RNA binding repeat